jgi:Outer membrane protein beta-barrel domain
MKRLILLMICSVYTLLSHAQVEFGIKAGLNSIDFVSEGITIKNGVSDLKIDYQNAEYGHHLGLYTRVKLLGIYVEPAFLFNSNKVNYKLTDYKEGQAVTQIFHEKYNTLDIPLVVGIKAGIIRLYGGPVAHLHINGTSDLVNFKSYSQKFKDANYGYQAGFGFDIWKLRLDVAYEGNLTAFGDHINIDGTAYSFGTAASRVLGTVGYKF